MARRFEANLSLRVGAMLVGAVALAFVEADVVVYLRETIVHVRAPYFPDAVREPLPLLSLDQLAEGGRRIASFLHLERIREVAALAVLLAMAVGFRRRSGEGTGFFLIGFAVWDIFYYVFLKVLMDWPASLTTWDVLFLIPIPWVAPVWAPLAVSATLLIAGVVALARGGGELSLRARLGASAAALAGVALILTSFMLRVPEAIGGVPTRFDWPWFLAGWVLGTAGLFWIVARPSTRRR